MTHPARIYRCLVAAVLCVGGVITPAAEQKPEAAAAPDESWTRSREPGGRKWNITNYLQGTTDEVVKSLNGQAMEADEKLAAVLGDLALNDRETASETAAVLAAVRATPEYAKAAAEAEAAKAAVDVARDANQSTAERMAASKRYNEVRQSLDAMERRALAASGRLSALKKDRPAMLAKVERLYEQRDKTMEWRTRLVNAILTGLTMRGPAVVGETTGLIRGATFNHSLGKDVIARFALFEYETVVGDVEGITKVQGRGQEIELRVKGLDNLGRLRGGDPISDLRVYRLVDRGLDPEAQRYVYVVEPHRCDEEDLVWAITKPPPFKAPVRPTPATKPVAEKAKRKSGQK